ncbi:MAG: glycosyltransferase family 2 protein [Chloroflexota bacterium]
MGNLVTIALPTYNGASKYINEAIESCLEQTHTNWELIVVDDTSTDNTPEVMASWCERDERIRYVRHEVNKRLPGALNTAIATMRGDYFTWVSDDDLFRPNALEVMVNYLETHNEVDLVYTDYSEIDAEGEIIRRIEVGLPGELGIHNVIGVCHLRRRKVLDTIGGYSEEFFLVEDIDFWIRAACNFPIAPYHEDLFLYRQHGGSLTSAHSKRVYPIYEEVLARHREAMHWMTPDKWAYAYLRLAKRAFMVRDYKRMLRYAGTAVCNHAP